MKRVVINISMVFIMIGASPACATKAPMQINEAKKTTESYIEAETYKALERELVQTLVDEHHSKFISKAIKTRAKQTMAKLSKAMAGMNSSQRIATLKRVAKSSKEGLKKLAKMSGGSIKHYVGSLTHTKSLRLLKQIVSGKGDKAGTWILKHVSDVDSMMARGAKVTKGAMQKLMRGAKNLPPKRAKAFFDLIAKKLAGEWKEIARGTDGAASFVGTVVDGVFVLNDAYNIYYIDDPEEKAIMASGKIIEYTGATVSTVAAGAVEGATTTLAGGFLPGLVIALSANRVATLYNEIMLLQKDRANTKAVLLNEEIDNGILMRRQLIKVNHLIEKGQLRKAQHLLYQVNKWSTFKKIKNKKGLNDFITKLEKTIKNAKRIEAINEIINQARFPYKEARTYHQQGRELAYALKLAKKSQHILTSKMFQYPEIKSLKALGYIEQLIAAINAKIANVKVLQIMHVTGDREVFAGEVVHYTLAVSGGIPDYIPVGIDGYGTKDSVTVYWQAPQKLGKKSVKFKIKDSMGSMVSTDISINVVAKEKEVKDIKLVAYTQKLTNGFHETMPGIKAVNTVNVEAHDVYPGNDIYFVVNINKPDYTYKWKINGVDDNSAGKYGKWGYTFWLTAADEPNLKRGVIGQGVNTISVSVYDKEGKRIGSDSWTVYIKDTSKGEYLMSPIMPDGDE